jgi:hypothetical protein
MRRIVPSVSRPVLGAALLCVLVLAGAGAWFVPYLTSGRQFVAEVAGPPALFEVTEFAVPAHEEACMDSIALDPQSDLATFFFRPAKQTPQGGPPLQLVLSATGYRGVVDVPGGYHGGSATLPITPPPTRTLLGTACFVNRGATTVLLDGTTEPRSVSRSYTEISGKPVVGDIALSFLSDRSQSLLDHAGEVFKHASNLTDRLVPVWLLWVLAVLVAIGVPVGMIAAFYVSLREDGASAPG